MKSVFELGFARDPWRPRLGAEPDIFGSIASMIKSGSDAFAAYEKTEAMKEVAEAQEKAAAAAAEAAKAQARATEVVAARTAAAEASAAAAPGGIPMPILIVGGIGLAAVAVVIALTRGK